MCCMQNDPASLLGWPVDFQIAEVDRYDRIPSGAREYTQVAGRDSGVIDTEHELVVYIKVHFFTYCKDGDARATGCTRRDCST